MEPNTVTPPTSAGNPEDMIPRAVLNERIREIKTAHGQEIAVLTNSLETARTDLATARTDLDRIPQLEADLETANGSLETQKAEFELSGSLTAAAGGALDPAVSETILGRYSRIDGEKPDFTKWLGEDPVAKALLGANPPAAEGGNKPKTPAPAPKSNGATPPGGTPPAASADLTVAQIQSMSIEELAANKDAIYKGDFGFT